MKTLRTALHDITWQGMEFVYVIKWFRVQFEINKYSRIFERLQK